MKLRLAKPDGHHTWILFADKLKGDRTFDPHRGSYGGFDSWERCLKSERRKFDQTVTEVERQVGSKAERVLGLGLFHQCQWRGDGGNFGTSGWEYLGVGKSDKQSLTFIREHASLVAQHFGLPIDLDHIDNMLATA